MDSIEQIKALIEPVVLEHHCFIYDVVFEKEANELFLRIYIDQEGGLDMDTCVTLSEMINTLLDEQASIEDVDYVEVSSPGLERPLFTKEQILGAVGDYVCVVCEANGELLEIIGTLKSFEEDQLLLEYFVKGVKKKITVMFDDVKSARLAIKM